MTEHTKPDSDAWITAYMGRTSQGNREIHVTLYVDGDAALTLTKLPWSSTVPLTIHHYSGTLITSNIEYAEHQPVT